ncbi:MAG TPA: ribonuclease HII [Candidatus Paceibacterota bacterium]
MKNLKFKWIIGVDEVGRGPLAGPVTVCVLAVPVTAFKGSTLRLGFQDLTLGPGPFDSKKLSAKKRMAIVRALKYKVHPPKIIYKFASVGARIIDRKGIIFAVNLAIHRALRRLGVQSSKCQVLLDGGLRAPKEYNNQRTIVRGDSSVPIIGLASVLAKVHRDKKMSRLITRYSKWGFEVHKGYGTRDHYIALHKYGPSPVHRLSFL